MKKLIKGQRGFTLIEIVIVLAILAILAALLVPQFGVFLRRGDEASYNADRETLEVNVIAYYTADPVVREWPIWGPNVGAPVDANSDGDFGDRDDRKNGLIHIWRLYDKGYIDGLDAVRSADGRIGRHDSAASEGSYVWYVADEHGNVRSLFPNWHDADGDGRVDPGEVTWVGDFQDVYP